MDPSAEVVESRADSSDISLNLIHSELAIEGTEDAALERGQHAQAGLRDECPNPYGHGDRNHAGRDGPAR
jgi:hypothetical protein